MKSKSTCAAVALLLGALPLAAASSTTRRVTVRGLGGYDLPAKLTLPAGETPRQAVVLLHGSGPQSMDEELSAVTEGGASNPFFRDLTRALVGEGFAVLRYHKRSYQLAADLKENPSSKAGVPYQDTTNRPLTCFLGDAEAALDLLARELPGARRYLLGHSQGAYLALQLARTRKDVSGVGVIGFALSSLDTLVFQQVVERPMMVFRRLDTDHDDFLDATERAAGGALGASLEAQLAVLDLDRDGRVAALEYRAGNLSNLLVRDLLDARYRVEEARLPTLHAVLRDLEKPVLFFNGLLDNQTPAENAQAVEMAARHVWNRDAFRFHYFPGLGHALDPRDAYDDLAYRRADPAALRSVAADMARHLR